MTEQFPYYRTHTQSAPAPRFIAAVVNPEAPLEGRLRFLRSALAVASLDAHRAALAMSDVTPRYSPTPRDLRVLAEFSGGALALDEAIALVDRLLPEAKP
jgi:hypothetical protein